MRLREVAHELGACPRTIRRRVIKGEIAAVRDGQRLLFEDKEVKRYKSTLPPAIQRAGPFLLRTSGDFRRQQKRP
jgi:excisionase family DNA binding protein